MRKIIVVVLICFVFLIGYNLFRNLETTEELSDVTIFSPQGDGEYLLFHLRGPYQGKGYINEVSDLGEIIKKHSITDKHFSSSDIFHIQDNYYFTSGGYSGETEVMKYSPSDKKISLIETNQNQFIEKYYRDDVSEYIITVLDKDSTNDICDIQQKKCISSPKGYMAHNITSIDNNVMVVLINNNPVNGAEKISSIQKYDRDLNLIKETTLGLFPNYFTYTHENQKLYLFMTNGDIVEVDGELNTKSYPMNFSSKIDGIQYTKNVLIEKGIILLNLTIHEPSKQSSSLVTLSFKNGVPQLKEVADSEGEVVLNIDKESNEVFTKFDENGTTIIKIRDLTTLHVTNTLNLDNNDHIYFVDNIKK
jgi:hypothetical protein